MSGRYGKAALALDAEYRGTTARLYARQLKQSEGDASTYNRVMDKVRVLPTSEFKAVAALYIGQLPQNYSSREAVLDRIKDAWRHREGSAEP